ncbi:sugar transferase [Microbacterium chocolatum]|uniref:sugar transferase n=1 Tax=Microbacterium aurantiacum TaxID=162393 RepID=UPI00338E764A
MIDSDYIAYLERQFASSEHPDEPPVQWSYGLSTSPPSEPLSQEGSGDLTAAIALLRPTSTLGPLFGLTSRDIELSAEKVRAGNPLSYRQTVAKRAFDIMIAIPALVLCAPLSLFIALLIRLESPGPIFFLQERMGLGGRRFSMLKFRTLRLDARDHLLAVAALADGEGRGGVLFKLRTDPRGTRVGTFLRTFSLDELPQFINVLRGDMSIVGPRPPLPAEGQSRPTLTVQPGVSGLWSVRGRTDLSWEESIRLDEDYARNWSLRRDLDILARTIRAVFSPTH